jgi:ubiquinone/menaquinone biosynthesis C-methylase UbiE
MDAGDKAFTGSIPEIYDRFLVPLIFESYAQDLAKRLAQVAPQAVLETAAGTGVVTRALAAQLPAGTRIVATDLNQPMLDRAKTQQPDPGRIAWQQADALSLPFEEGSFDAVVCQFGVMFFPDKVQGYKEARRVLKPGGRFLFNAWDKISENEFVDTATQALAEIFPGDPPRFMERTPHGYHDPERIRDDLKAAGWSNISIEPVDARSRAASALDAVTGYCQGSPLRTEIEARNPPSLQEATIHAANAVAARFGSGAVEGRIRALVVTAIR